MWIKKKLKRFLPLVREFRKTWTDSLRIYSQIVEDYEFMLENSLNKTLSATQICGLGQNKGCEWTFRPYFMFDYKMRWRIVCKNVYVTVVSISGLFYFYIYFVYIFSTRCFYCILHANVKYGQNVQPLFWLKSLILIDWKGLLQRNFANTNFSTICWLNSRRICFVEV